MNNNIKTPVTREQFQETLEWLNYNGPVSTPDLDTLISESDKKYKKLESIDA